jgi:hypothetical protein
MVTPNQILHDDGGSQITLGTGCPVPRIGEKVSIADYSVLGRPQIRTFLVTDIRTVHEISPGQEWPNRSEIHITVIRLST